jgi:hypothetical protein
MAKWREACVSLIAAQLAIEMAQIMTGYAAIGTTMRSTPAG